MRARLALGALGLAAAAYGVWRLLGLGWHNLLETALWYGGGVLAHDALLAPVVLALGLVAGRALRGRALTGLVVVAVVVGTVTVSAIPQLGRFGARPDNPSLLDRDYLAGWVGLTALVVLAVGAGLWWDAHSRDGGRSGGDGAGRR